MQVYPITRDQGFCCGGRDVDSEKGKNDSLVFVPAEDGVSAAFMLLGAGGVGFHTHRSSCLGARSLNSSSTHLYPPCDPGEHHSDEAANFTRHVITVVRDVLAKVTNGMQVEIRDRAMHPSDRIKR